MIYSIFLLGEILKEFEVKIPVEDLNEIEEKLKNLGAIFEGYYEEKDYYLDARPCIDFKSIDSALRIRTSKNLVKGDTHCEITFKSSREKHSFAKIRKEISVSIDNSDKMLEIFTSLGFKTAATILKKRKVFRYSGWRIYLDDVVDLGRFVEIEFSGEITNLSDLEKNVYELISILNLPKIFISKSYLELITERKSLT